MKKHFGKIILMLAVVGGIFILFNREKVWNYSIPYINKSPNEITEEITVKAGRLAKKHLANISSVISAVVPKAADTVSEKTSEIVSGAVNEAKKIVLVPVKEAIDNQLREAGVTEQNKGLSGQSLPGQGITIQTKDFIPSGKPMIFFSMKANEAVYFTIKNQEEIGIEYEADWQDGKIDRNSLDKGKSALLSHVWSKNGDYMLKFKIIVSGQEKKYEIPINIF